MDDQEVLATIVIDNGSSLCKVGIAGDDAPKAIISTVVGHPRNPENKRGMNLKDWYIGNEA